MNVVRSSLRHPPVTLVLTGMLCLAGIQALLHMPRREDPKITIRVGLVAALYPGATAEQIEAQVTRKIEERLFRFAEVRKARTFSTSRNDLVVINVELEDRVTDTDKFWTKLRNDLNVLKATDLPAGVQGPIVDSDFGDTIAVLIAIRGERYGYRELKEYAQRIEDELRTLRAVSKIRRIGDQREEIVISSTLERLAQYAMSPRQVIYALQSRNAVSFAGNFDTEHGEVPLKIDALFNSEDQIRRVMVDLSRTGQPVYIGDLAKVERHYKDPQSMVRFNSERALLLSVEMQEGQNIVEFGHALGQKLEAVRSSLPPDLRLDLIADQPKVVEERISHFFREFAIAIGAVILVTMLLLPLRVATIAALAIPVTVAVTFAVMNALGIELHQVSIAALIVVLGMVVDDAIVIADNYVELLDRRMPIGEAAWHCASDLAIPVLTATLTIIAAFLPLLMLSGSVGEFIGALPITVAVALSSSYVVAMLLTPLLNRFFIRTGLGHDEGPRKPGVLDFMQSAYGWVIERAMRRKAVTLAMAVLSVAAGVLVLKQAPEQFFPSAERNQFVIDVWLPEGTRIEATDEALRRIEATLSTKPEVVNHATFTGASAPRFYYNVNPEQPAGNYGQLLVNTQSASATPGLVHRLRAELAMTAPEARVIVKELQQGNVVAAPIEVRLVGDDAAALKTLGEKVERILADTHGAAYVHHDYREDRVHLDVEVNEEISSRLGMSHSSISQQLAGGFQGAPVTTFWEGDRAVDVSLRIDESRRQTFEDIQGAYMTSALTGVKVPLREVARLEPAWQTGRIVRRNGVRTLTVRAFHDERHLASEVLKRARPRIAALTLPEGYRIEYGGETENQVETFGEMVRALLVSLVAIFLILLLQFKSLSEPLVVMASIPLALLGAAVGLVITRNPFGFTAFMGMISLTGVVVRNAIILVDYINERREQGVDLEQAALEAGQRRLRPIFLTSMAAAVGVLPMIVSGSNLWSPLASAIAVGLMFSMFFTLVVAPVLFVVAQRPFAHTEKVSQ